MSSGDGDAALTLVDVDVSLVGASADDVRLAEAVELVAAAGLLTGSAVGMVWSATRFTFVAVDGGTLIGPTGPEPLASVFEARLFSPAAEVRWLHRAAGRGRAVVLAEQAEGMMNPLGGLSAPWAQLEARSVRATVGNHYLLWGEALGPTTGAIGVRPWSTLGTNRIGSLDVPVEAPEGARVVIAAREYVGALPAGAGEVDVGGNAVVVDERLVALLALVGGRA